MFSAGVSLIEDFDSGSQKAPRRDDADSLIHSAVQIETYLGDENRGRTVRTGSGEECIRETPILPLDHGHMRHGRREKQISGDGEGQMV